MPVEFILYGFPSSTATNRVRLMLADANFTDYDFVIVNIIKDEHKTPAHLALNPFGRIPVLRMPNGFVLYESRAICAFLATTFSLPHVPSLHSPSASAIEARALFDQALHAEMTTLTPALDVISIEKFAKKIGGVPADEQRVAEARKRISAHLDVVEGVMADGREWMVAGPQGDGKAGGVFGLVDVCHVIVVQRLRAAGEGEALFTGRTNLEAWWQRCLARERVGSFLDGVLSIEQIRESVAASKKV